MAVNEKVSDLKPGFLVMQCQPFPIAGRKQVTINGAIRAGRTHEGKFPALLVIAFRDVHGEQIVADRLEGLSRSPDYGDFAYLGSRGQEGEISFSKTISVPAGAAKIDIALRGWYCEHIEVSTPPEIADRQLQGLIWTRLVDVSNAFKLALNIQLNVAGGHEAKPPALVSFAFFDRQGNELAGPFEGLHSSDRYGHFRYLGKPASEGPVSMKAVFPVPKAAVSASIRLFQWKCREASLIAKPKISLEKPEAQDDSRSLLASAEIAVCEGEAYEIAYTQSNVDSLVVKGLLVKPFFSDEAGDFLPPAGNVPISPQLGHYRYLEAPADTGPAMKGRQIASFIAPRGARLLRADVYRWLMQGEPGEHRLEVTGLDNDALVCARGEIEVPAGHSNVVLSGDVRLDGALRRKAGIMELLFETDDGQRITLKANGLKSSSRFLNHIELVCRQEDGVVPLQSAFELPEGTSRILWRLRPEPGLSLDLASPLSLQTIPRTIPGALSRLPDEARLTAGVDDLFLHDMRGLLRITDFWKSAFAGKLSIVGEAVCATGANEWIIFSGHVATAGSLAPGCRFVIHPVYFDADGAPLDFDELPGCSMLAGAGCVRYASSSPARGQELQFREPFLTPPGAYFAAFYLACLDGPRPQTAGGLSLKTVQPDEIHEGLDTTGMDLARIKQASELAQRTANLPARRALAIARASFELKDQKIARSAELLSDELLELQTDWLPALPPQAGHDADPRSILHLFKVIYPDENSGGAVRSSSIVEAQAGQGLHPVVCMPLNSPRPLQDRQANDQIIEIVRNGVSVCYPDYPGLDRKRLAKTSLLEIETDAAADIVRRHSVGLIHAASGFRGYENALKGLALAKAFNLPMVYEVRSFHEHTWRPIDAVQMGDSVTRLRMAQEDRCMMQSDAVVTISRAMAHNLRERGVAEDDIFVVPNAIDRIFETQPGQEEIQNLREVHSLLGKTSIGYISNFSEREGHQVLLDAFTHLVAQGLDLHLVMVGDGPQRKSIMAEVRERGLAERVVMPGNVDHAEVRTWYHAIDLFVVPRIPDFASDYVTPLKPFEAMAQNIPLIMSRRPVTAEIAGDQEERAATFPAGDDHALAELIKAELSDPDRLRDRAARARQWVLAERTWSSVVRQYEPAYEAARRVHSERMRMGASL